MKKTVFRPSMWIAFFCLVMGTVFAHGYEYRATQQVPSDDVRYENVEPQTTVEQEKVRVSRDERLKLREEKWQIKLQQKAAEREKKEAVREEGLKLRAEAKRDKLQQKAAAQEKEKEVRDEQLRLRTEEKKERLILREKEKQKQLSLREERNQERMQQKLAQEEQAKANREEKLRLLEEEKQAWLQQKAAQRAQLKAKRNEQLRLREEEKQKRLHQKAFQQEQAEADRQERLRLAKEEKQAKLEQKVAEREKAKIMREERLRLREKEKQKQLRLREEQQQERLQQKLAQQEQAKAMREEKLRLGKEKKQAWLQQKAIERAQLKAERDEQLRLREEEKQKKLDQKLADQEQAKAIQEERLRLREKEKQKQLRLREEEKQKKFDQKLADQEQAEADRQERLRLAEEEKQAKLEQKLADQEQAKAMREEQLRLGKERKQVRLQQKSAEQAQVKAERDEQLRIREEEKQERLEQKFARKEQVKAIREQQSKLANDEKQARREQQDAKNRQIKADRKERFELRKEERQALVQQQIMDYNAQVEQASKRVMFGREYYYTLLDVSMQRKWAVPITCNFSITNGAFDTNGQHTSLGAAALGGTVTLEDIYLFSRLGDENLVGNRSNAGGGQPPTKSPGVGQSGNLPFGAYANDLYTTLLAPMQIGFGLQQSEACVDFTAMYRFDIAASGKVLGFVGGTLPVKTGIVDADLQLQQGVLYVESFAAHQTVVRERTLTQFFADYEDVDDFFIREVLGGKGISFANRQVKVGMGDFSLFGLIDIGGLWEYADGIQFGLTIVFPTGSAGNPNILFNPSFTDGVYRFEPFFSAIFNSPSAAFNPAVKLVGSFSSSRSTGSSGGTRLGQTLSNGARVPVNTIAGLSAPARFANYYVSAFNETTSSVPMLGDSAVPATIKLGNKFLVGVGNYFFNVFNLGFRLGIFYDYTRKSSDRVSVDACQGSFDTCALTANTQERSHSIGVNLTYKFKNMLELNVGTENVIGGRNVPRTNDFFVSMIAVF